MSWRSHAPVRSKVTKALTGLSAPWTFHGGDGLRWAVAIALQSAVASARTDASGT